MGGKKIKCPICGSKSGKIFKKGVWDDPEKNVICCSKCRTLFLSPMMNPAEMATFYSKYIEHRKKRQPSRKDYLSLDKKATEAAKRQLKLVSSHLRKNMIFCDIGASNGNFLDVVKRNVKKIIAVEPSFDALRKLKLKKIQNFKWLDLINPNRIKFDAVSMFHTFEHLPDPLGYLANLKKYLNKGAKIFVEVPNCDDALIGLYSSSAFKNFYFQKMHCFYYNAETLNNVFKKSGFKVVGNINIQRYGISNHLNWLAFGRPGGNAIFEKIFADADQSYRVSLIKSGKSDTILSIYSLNPPN